MATVDFGVLSTEQVFTGPPREQDQCVAEEHSSPEWDVDDELCEDSTPMRGGFHRIREVRMQQGVSLRTAARHTGVEVRQLRRQEQEETDLRLSDLHKWQKALDVPVSELIEEPETDLSPPIMERARMVRLMKTAAAIKDRADGPIERMAEMMVEQLVEIMPELKEVSGWHNFGQRRSLDDYGRVVERRLSLDATHYSEDD